MRSSEFVDESEDDKVNLSVESEFESEKSMDNSSKFFSGFSGTGGGISRQGIISRGSGRGVLRNCAANGCGGSLFQSALEK